jgi:hypothetical protein
VGGSQRDHMATVGRAALVVAWVRCRGDFGVRVRTQLSDGVKQDSSGARRADTQFLQILQCYFVATFPLISLSRNTGSYRAEDPQQESLRSRVLSRLAS